MEQNQENQNDWWPTKEEYDPKISKDEWIELLHDESVFDFNSMCMMHRMLDIGGEATNSEISEKYETKNGYNAIVKALAQRIIKKKGCDEPPYRSEEKARYWPVLFVGKEVQKDDEHEGTYIWKLRPELEEALKQIKENGELEKYPLYENGAKNAWLLTWNEKNWNWEKYDDWCAGTKNGETYTESWTCKNKQPKIGDHVFLIKLGDEPRGIIAHGFVSKESYETESYNNEKITSHIDVEFDLIRNYKSEDILNIEILKSKIPNQNWSPRTSGIEIKENNAKKLLELWNELNGGPAMSNETNSLAEKLKNLLLHTPNLILHGAPGTGKTHLTHEIAKELGCGKNEVGFVQFHPSYDYTDFVEGLRPVKSSDGTSSIGFERKDGVFKEFCKWALKNLTDSKKTVEDLQKEISTDEQIENFLEKAIDDETEFEIAHGNKFKIVDSSDKTILISIPANKITNELSLPKSDLVQLLNSNKKIENGADIKSFFNRKWRTQQDSYILTLYNEISAQKEKKSQPAQNVQKVEKENFLFIIDEINRGELSKIFGELFYAIEPGYRGEKGRIQTQYQNLVEESDVFKSGFFIPENVYIIGTMNDIDRSVDTMDFAFRRRFTFYEIEANYFDNFDKKNKIEFGKDHLGMFTEIKDKSIRETAINKMKNLNNAISAIEGLNLSYHIGGAYFLKLNELGGNFEQLWNYHLEGLLREYLRGRDDAKTKLGELKNAYDKPSETEQK